MKKAVPLAKNSLVPLGITAADSAFDTGIQKKINDSGRAALIISNKEMNEIMKILEALADSNILLKIEIKEQKRGFLGMLLGILRATLLGDIFSDKGIVRANYRNKEGKWMLRAGFESKNFNSTSSFSKYWNTEVLSEWTQIFMSLFQR